MWLLLVSYAAGLHLLALVRGTHYFTLDQGHVVVLLAKRLRVVGMFGLWWALLVLWPLPLYFIALSPNAGEWMPSCSGLCETTRPTPVAVGFPVSETASEWIVLTMFHDSKHCIGCPC
jgi:hypothetical protein